jgi:hypothetical protein
MLPISRIKLACKYVLFLVLVLLFLFKLDTPVLAVTKKGVCVPPGSNSTLQPIYQYDVLNMNKSLGITWWYDWGWGIGATGGNSNSLVYTPGVEYVPMVWKSLPGEGSVEWNNFKKFAQNRPGSWWLIFNEPNISDQANLTPQDAAALYKQIRNTIKSWDPTAKLIVGGVSIMGNLGEGRDWFEKFFRDYFDLGEDDPIPPTEVIREHFDGWHFHAYADTWLLGPPYSRSSWIAKVEGIIDWVKENNGGEIWVTEWGVLWEGLDISSVMSETLSYLENNNDITRYAWFATHSCLVPNNLCFKGSLLLDPLKTDLTAAGQIYKNQVSKNPYSNATLSPSQPTATPSPQKTFNLDNDPLGLINQADLNLLLSYWNSSGSPALSPAQKKADFNNDGKVNETDLNLLLANWQETSLGTPTKTSTSTPAQTPTDPPSGTGCADLGGVCCAGDYSYCVPPRLIYPYNEDGTVNTSGGCNPERVFPLRWCCSGCRE